MNKSQKEQKIGDLFAAIQRDESVKNEDVVGLDIGIPFEPHQIDSHDKNAQTIELSIS